MVLVLNIFFLSVLTSLIFLCFPHLAWFFQKLHYSWAWKNYNLKIISCFFFSFVFISKHGFNQTSWLNLVTLRTFFEINPLLNGCLKFLMWITYSVSSYKLVTSFLGFFPFSFFLVKMVDHYENFSEYWIPTSRKPFRILNINCTTFFGIAFYETFIKLKTLFYSLEMIYWRLLRIAQPYKLFTSQYLRYDDSLFLS